MLLPSACSSDNWNHTLSPPLSPPPPPSSSAVVVCGADWAGLALNSATPHEPAITVLHGNHCLFHKLSIAAEALTRREMFFHGSRLHLSSLFGVQHELRHAFSIECDVFVVRAVIVLIFQVYQDCIVKSRYLHGNGLAPCLVDVVH